MLKLEIMLEEIHGFEPIWVYCGVDQSFTSSKPYL